MRQLATLLFTIMLAFATTPITHAADDEVVTGAEAFIKAWADTFNKNSPDAMVALYDPSDSTEMLVSAGLRHEGIAAIRKAYELDQKNIAYYDSHTLNLKSRVLGDTVVVCFEHKFKFRALESGNRYEFHIYTTSILRRTDGSWRILHEHSSKMADAPWGKPIRN